MFPKHVNNVVLFVNLLCATNFSVSNLTHFVNPFLIILLMLLDTSRLHLHRHCMHLYVGVASPLLSAYAHIDVWNVRHRPSHSSIE